jgi:glutamate N-acetyltransferase / amino-acid N-acetyltransferase
MLNPLPPLGFQFAGVACGLKKTGAADLALVVSDRPCTAAATFTRNRFAAAPVMYDRALLQEKPLGLRAVVINAGIANACTGAPGLADAASMASMAESMLRLPQRSCAVMSTGVIGPRLPLEKVEAGLRLAADELAETGWEAAARAIMTTDTRPKMAFRRAGSALLFGMAKGAGMIQPNMATMLSLIVTDAAVTPEALTGYLHRAVEGSFNSVTIDGDTSTNDTVLVLANGNAGEVDGPVFAQALIDLCADLAQQIVRDGEGATKFITIRVEGAASDRDAQLAAKAVANSPLVKTAFFGGDANWGRILAAVGYSGAEVDPGQAGLWIASGSLADSGPTNGGGAGDKAGNGLAPLVPLAQPKAKPQSVRLQLVAGGEPLAYSEAQASAIFAGSEIAVTVNLGLGQGAATVWTCDLSHGYVDINGHYRT